MTNTKRDRRGNPDFWLFARTYLHVELPVVRELSEKTIEAYRLALECFLQYLNEEEGIAHQQVTFDCFERRHIKEFVSWMKDTKGYGARTVSLRLAAIKSFLCYGAQEDITLVALFEAAKSIRSPKAPKQPIKYLSREATAALLSAPGSATTKRRRNQMVLIMLYDTGARVSELVSIKVCDLHLYDPAFVLLHGKGNKPRNVPLMKKTVTHLKKYLDEFHPECTCQKSSEPLFYSNHCGKHEHLSTDTVSSILGQYVSKARQGCSDMPKRVTCHMIRKTRAMDLYKEGIALPVIMRLLGHENMNTTTTFYAFATMEMVTEAIDSTTSLGFSEPKRWKSVFDPNAVYSLK